MSGQLLMELDRHEALGLSAVGNAAPPSAAPGEAAGLAERLATEAAGADRLRLKQLAGLVEKGALDHDIYEAVVHGTVYFVDDAEPTPDLADEFRLRYKCDLWAYPSGPELLDAVRGRLPAAVVLGGHPAGLALGEILPELLVAAFGAEPVAVVVRTDDEAVRASFEVLTYPRVRLVGRSAGPEELLAALAELIDVERTGAELRSDEAIKEQFGLTKAQAVQQKLLPEALPSVPGLDVAAYYSPCQEVGGDYYDFIPQPDGRLAIVCADVSGKGVSAAMLMVMFRSILRLAAERGLEPSQVLRVTNKRVTKDMLRGMFVSALYLRIDPETGRTALVNAGHMPPIHWPAAAASPVEMAQRGVAVGLVTGDRFAQTTPQSDFTLDPGDLLCLYTDGVAEAANRAGEQFGAARLHEAIRAAGRASAQHVVDGVMEAVRAFCDGAPPHDDTTLIVLKVTD